MRDEAEGVLTDWGEGKQGKTRIPLNISIPFSFDTMLASVRRPISTRGVYEVVTIAFAYSMGWLQ